MEVRQAILERRSVRRYSDRPVSDEILTEILEAAVWAPSGVNLQPWYFAVVRSEEARNRVLDCMKLAVERFRPTLEQRFANNPQVVTDTVSFMETYGGAPVLVLAFLYADSYTDGIRFSSEQSVAAAMQNICLLAHDKGLSTCWTTGAKLIDRELEAAFGEGKGSFMGVISLGWGEQPEYKPPRKNGRFALL